MPLIYILSLKDDINRRKLIKSQLDQLNFKHQFIDAPDGRKNIIPRRASSKLKNTEAACALGHLDIYRNFLASQANFCIILEDDVAVNFKHAINLIDILKSIPINEASICLLGGIGERKIFDFFVGLKVDECNGTSIYKCFKSEDRVYGTCCYIINKIAASRILELNNDLEYLADDWSIFKKNNIIESVYLAEPSLFIHPPINSSTSYIENDRSIRMKNNKKYKLTRTIINFLGISYLKNKFIYLYRKFMLIYYILNSKKI